MKAIRPDFGARPPETMKLADILAGAEIIHQSADPELEITGIAFDSREIRPGWLFIAVPGFKSDGNRFIADAASAGAAAAIAESWPEAAALPLVQVASSRQTMALAAANFFDHPSEKLALVGVTGTNGKTTTVFMIDAILKAAGRKSGLLGGIEYRLGDESLPAARTTPESVRLQHMLARMVTAGAEAATIEVSSHGIELARADCLDFDVAVFTNLSPEHLDLHGDMESYFAVKRQLFTGPLPCGGQAGAGGRPRAAINTDDPFGQRLAAELPDAITFGLTSGADVTAGEIKSGGWQSSFKLRYADENLDICLAMPGSYNVLNALAAAAAARALELPAATVAAGLNGFTGVPGRFERLESDTPFAVVIDYAHNEDGLKRALGAARELASGRVIVVFGCPGERDREKRPGMGRIAGTISDFAILTTDDCYSEPPEAILDETEPGLVASDADYRRISDRRQAIAYAIAMARAGDVILIAGKGHESRQIMADGALPFSDRQVALELLARA